MAVYHVHKDVVDDVDIRELMHEFILRKDSLDSLV